MTIRPLRRLRPGCLVTLPAGHLCVLVFVSPGGDGWVALLGHDGTYWPKGSGGQPAEPVAW